MTQNKNITTTVGYQVNQASVAQVQAANQQIASSLTTIQGTTLAFSVDLLALNPQLAQLAATQQQAANATAQNTSAMAQQATGVQDLTALYAALDDQEKQVAADAAAAANASANTGGGGISTGGARSALRAGGFLLGADAGGGGLRAAGQIIALTNALGGVGIVAGVAAVALRAATEEQQKETQAIEARVDAERQVAHEVASLNTQQLQEKQQAAQEALQIDKDFARQQSANALQHQLDIVSDPIALGRSLAGLDPLTNAWNDELAKNTVAIAADQAQIDAYTGAIDRNAGAAQDAVAADKQIDSAQLELAHASADAMNMTADARRKEIDSISAHITALEEAKDDYYIIGAAADALNAEINSLENRLVAVTDTTYSWADALADVQKRADAVDNLFDAITAEGEAEQKVAAARQAVADSAQEHANKLVEIQQDEQDKETTDRQKAAQQAEDDQAKHLQRLAEIDAQYSADHEAAVGNRDALANYQAIQKRDKDTKKENDAYTLQEQQLQAHLEEQLAADKAAQQKQIDAENASYAKRNAQLIAALNDAQVEESRAAGEALGYQRQANDAQLNERIRANTAVENANVFSNAMIESVQAVHQQAMLNTADAYGGAIVTSFNGTMAGLLIGVNNFALKAGVVFDALGGATLPVPGSNGGLPGLNFGSNADAYFRSIINNQVARMMRDANR